MREHKGVLHGFLWTGLPAGQLPSCEPITKRPLEVFLCSKSARRAQTRTRSRKQAAVHGRIPIQSNAAQTIRKSPAKLLDAGLKSIMTIGAASGLTNEP